MSAPEGNSFVFFLHSQCFLKMKSGQEKIGLDGKQNLLFPSGADLKCFFILTANQHNIVNIQAKNECYFNLLMTVQLCFL